MSAVGTHQPHQRPWACGTVSLFLCFMAHIPDRTPGFEIGSTGQVRQARGTVFLFLCFMAHIPDNTPKINKR